MREVKGFKRVPTEGSEKRFSNGENGRECVGIIYWRGLV